MDRIRVDGFPRSGNTFFQSVLEDSFPNKIIIPFQHNANSITNKHFILIRNPNESISSFMSVFQEPNIESSERWWIRFYSTALKKSDVSRWIFFDDLIYNTENVIVKIGNTLNVEPNIVEYSKYNKNKAPVKYPLYLFDKSQKFYLELKENNVRRSGGIRR